MGTLHAEGMQRFLESLSTYGRRRLTRLPDHRRIPQDVIGQQLRDLARQVITFGFRKPPPRMFPVRRADIPAGAQRGRHRLR
jgi:hypothetical protein